MSDHRPRNPKSSARVPRPLRWLATTVVPTMPVHNPNWLNAWPARLSSSSPEMANHRAANRLARA
jgi:hypothetical protein